MGFRCGWLKSQKSDAPLALELRPDKCGVIMSSDTSAYVGEIPDPNLIEAHYERGREPSPEIIEYLLNKKVKIVTHYWGENE